MASLSEIEAALRKTLSSERFTHTLGVRNTAVEFHSAWKLQEPSEDEIQRMALLHDYAKEMGPIELHRALVHGWLTLGTELLDFPGLDHAPLSAAYARHKFGVTDHSILSAIAYHPTGHPSFGPVGLILFLSDYLEPNRPFENHRGPLLQTAYENPERAALEVYEEKLHYVQLQDRQIHPISLAFEHSLRKRLNSAS